ncbi:MAG TPA: hypothetical protein VF121_09560 [Thermoanaerobaculia bacterium]|nr:hypothetical protein [Thermoanaerobaculia bacterium]
MSVGAEPEPDSASDQAYFQAIEETFVRLRGAPLLLSPADWQVARRWHRQGVPLLLVQRVLEEVFERRRERAPKGRINSLRYCRQAVEAAWSEVQQLTAPGRRTEVEPLDVAPRLAALAAALPAALAGREELATRVRRLGESAGGGPPAGDSEAVEAALAALDRELLERAGEALSEEARGALEEAVETTLAALAARLPAEDLAAARERLRRQLLRQRLGLPVLSLFSPEAAPAG